MEFVDIPIKRAIMQSLVCEEMVEVFKHKEARDLQSRLPERWEGDLPSVHSEILCQGMEEPNAWELDSEVGKEDELGTFPLLLGRWDLCGLEFVLAEVLG